MFKKQTLRALALSILLAGVVVIQGCSHPIGAAGSYGASQALGEQTVRFATVQTVKMVTLTSDNAGGLNMGTIGGGALGAVAGSALGGGRGSMLTGIAGGLAGAMAGNAIQNRAGKQQGIEITVKLDNGDLRSITQNIQGETFKPGDRVRLLSNNGVTRVTH